MAQYPMATPRLPALFCESAPAPKATLLDTLVAVARAPSPTAVLADPVQLAKEE
jgi:hypothetical protein